jgi:hypothetical protein
VTDDQLVLALDALGWHLLSSPRSSWVVVRKGGHIFAGESLASIVERMERKYMPRYRSKPKPPASGEESGAALGVPPARSFGPSPGFGRVPSSPGERTAFTRRGPGGHKSSQENPVPPTHVEPTFTPKQEV